MTSSVDTIYPIRAVERVCVILDVLADSRNGVSLGEVAAITGLPKPSVFRYLWSLENHHYVEKNPLDGTYRRGPAFRPEYTLSLTRLMQTAQPLLAQLRDSTQETTNLGVLDGTQIMHNMVCESAQMMRVAARVGDRGMLHSTALGKAIASLLPDDRVRTILRTAGMPRFTSRTILTADAYMAELAQVRELGYAVDAAENQDDGLCVAVPVAGLSFPAGISISAPESRLAPEAIPAVAGALRVIAEQLGEEMRAWSTK